MRAVALAAALLAASPVHGAGVADWRPYIAEASRRFGVPVAWIERVMQAESGGRTLLGGRPITSRAGAMGLMQLMPGTWAEMRRAHGLGPDPHDPRDNILAGTAYLRLMHDRCGYPGLFAAYNAGPARYAVHLSSGRRLPGETRAYLESVAGAASMAVDAPRPARSIFFVLGERDGKPAPSKHASPGTGLFALMVTPFPGREH
ncbi:lytic transglycosylase domain-containing protein [uncultured Sphingomonas sp.]|uniref:lytic transglycosylase domain-containing protein n=1 Tax=uncultured Sphingomonas sp. TaxID=158754 RepID=UPI0035CB4E7F